MSVVEDLKHDLNDAEHRLLVQLRFLRRRLRAESAAVFGEHELTLGQRIADAVLRRWDLGASSLSKA